MRPATQIRASAEEALADLADLDQTENVKNAQANLREIIAISKKVDARTGTNDPSSKRPQPPQAERK